MPASFEQRIARLPPEQQRLLLQRLAAAGRAADPEPSPMIGPAALTPNQHMSFETPDPDRHIWTSAALLEIDRELRPELLQQAVRRLPLHHDALRLRSIHDEGRWRQVYAAPDDAVPFSWIDLTGRSQAEQRPIVEAAVAELQTSLNLTDGPLMRVALFELGAGQPRRLLMTVHHTVCDGFSWRILIEDLLNGYEQLSHGAAIRLPARTTALNAYAERLDAYAQSAEVRRELAYWLEQGRAPLAPLPVDDPAGVHLGASARTITSALELDETEALRSSASATGVGVNDLLLAALVQSMADWTGRPELLIDLEYHGRTTPFDDIDLSRTVGWLNYLAPVRIDLSAVADARAAPAAVARQLRQVPQQGIGYGLLRYLCRDPQVRAQIQALPQPQVLFNYRGNFTDDLAVGPFRLRAAPERIGPTHSARVIRRHLLILNCFIGYGRFSLEWIYSEQVHRPATIDMLAQRYIAALKTLIAAGAG